MVLRTVQGIATGEDVEDLRSFLSKLPGSPEVHETVVLGCDNHEDERPTWMYVEADAREGVARRRCLQCAQSVPLLDSADRWTHPPMWACGTCSQSIAEVAVGLSVREDEKVTWVVLGARCADCGRIDGLTDFVLAPTPLTQVLEQL
jgi:hypothetical protein